MEQWVTLAERWVLNQDKKSGGVWEEVWGSESKSRTVLDEELKENRLLSSEQKGFSANKKGGGKHLVMKILYYYVYFHFKNV